MIEEPITPPTLNRLRAVVQKIPREVTGLNGSLFVHVDFDLCGANAVSFSCKGKDNSTLDKILVALGRAVTEIIRAER